jgi:hypothetical protein
VDHGIRNDIPLEWKSASGERGVRSTNIEGIRVNANDSVVVNRQAVKPVRVMKKFQIDANGDIADTAFFIADRHYKIHGIEEVHATAANDSGAVTAIIRRCEGTETVTEGHALCSAFSLKGTKDTVQAATLVDDDYRADVNDLTLELNEGDRLAIDFTGVLTTLANVVVTVEMSPSNESETVDIYIPANGDLADQAFYIATRPMRVVGIKQIHGTLGSHGSAVTLQVSKLLSTEAAGSGTVLLTNNSDAGFNLKSTINAVQEGALATSLATRRLAAGNRLALEFTGTLTAVAGLCVSVELEPAYDREEVVFNLEAAASLGTDACIFIADRNYRIIGAKQSHATANGGALNLQLEVCTGTTAPGSGTDLLSNNTSNGFDLNATADTVQSASWQDVEANYLQEGDRLAISFSTTMTSLAGLNVVVALEAI